MRRSIAFSHFRGYYYVIDYKEGGVIMGLAESDLSGLQDAKSRLKVAGLMLLRLAEYKKIRGDIDLYGH